MKRPPVILAVLLPVGALLSLAIAAACAIFGPYRSHSWLHTQNPPEDQQVPFETVVRTTSVQTVSCFGYEYVIDSADSSTPGSCFVTMEEIGESCRAGWPVHVLTGSRSRPAFQAADKSTMWKPPFKVAPVADRRVVLAREVPLTPMWGNLLGSSLLYASAIYLPFLVLWRLRWFLRLRAGRCPRCKYPIGNSPVCTECGAGLPARRTIAP